jgi:hypothetical protein
MRKHREKITGLYCLSNPRPSILMRSTPGFLLCTENDEENRFFFIYLSKSDQLSKFMLNTFLSSSHIRTGFMCDLVFLHLSIKFSGIF